MSLAPYSDYTNSSIDWLQEIPSNWRVRKFRYVFRESGEKIEGTPVGRMLSVSGYRGIEVKQYDDENRRRTDEELQGYRIVHPGQLVVNTMWLNYAGLGISEYEGHVSPAYRAYWLVAEEDRRYIHYLMRSAIYVQAYTKLLTGVRPNSLQMSHNDLMDFPVILPPLDEQRAIADFLDESLSGLDQLIQAQEALLTLISEKRLAVVSDAVKRGLNKSIPFKESGVHWLGKIPSHWEVRTISSLTSKITNGYVGPTRNILVDEGVRYLQSLHIKDNNIQFNEPYFVREEWSSQHKKSILRVGDVLIVQTGDIGQVAAVPKEFEGCNCHALIIVTPVHEVLDGNWLSWVLNGDYGNQTLLSIQTGALHPHLNCGNVKDVLIPVPPLSEQLEICKYINGKLQAFTELSKAAKQAIALLKERRASLISSAVTGMIDVRARAKGMAA